MCERCHVSVVTLVWKWWWEGGGGGGGGRGGFFFFFGGQFVCLVCLFGFFEGLF